MGLSIKQKILLDLMVRCDKIMKEHDIKYFLFGGSTLGALRHKGFIPWDDDIDIIMDVEDYYKLEKVFENGPIDGIDLIFFHNDPYWYRSFAMLVNLEDTCYTNPVMFSGGKATGTRIDVMMCDYVPKERLEEYRHDLMLYQEVLTDSLMVDINIHEIKDEYFALRERIAAEGKVPVERELRNNLESYATSDDDELVVRFWTIELRHYEKELLYPPLYVDFEGHKLPIPAKPEEQMRLQFGNDWYIIPEQEEFMFHAFVDNYYISGNNYHDDIVNFIERESAEEEVRKRKAVLLERAKYSLDNSHFRSNLAFQREMMRADFEKNYDYYSKLISSGRYEEYYKAMEGLLKVRKHAQFVPKEHKNIPDDLMSGWLEACVYCGKYYHAMKLLDAFEIEDGLDKACDLIERVRVLAEAIQDRKTADMKAFLQNFTEEEQKIVPECIMTRIEFMKNAEGQYAEQASKVIDNCNYYLDRFPNNYEIMKIKADALYEQGREKEAMSLYDIVHEKTVNGMDLYDIENRFNYKPRFTGKQGDPLDIMLGESAVNKEIFTSEDHKEEYEHEQDQQKQEEKWSSEQYSPAE